MDRNPPPDPNDRTRSRWDRSTPERAGTPPGVDPEATRPMPAAERGRHAARRLNEGDLPTPPRWAMPRDQQAPPAPSAPPQALAPPTPQAPAAPRSAQKAARPAPTRRRWRRGTRIVLLLLGLVFLGICAWAAPLIFKGQQLVSDLFVTPPPRPAGMSAFPDWDKQERVNILLLGLDTRVPGDSRSDTMILVSIDPAKKSVAMLSIPRDLWVTIPGVGENRINAAYQFGETNQTPGGGPGLAMQTVEQNFGVPVHYFAQIDFQGFRRIVDALGGVTVDVQHPLIDNQYPADYGYAYQRIYIPAGLQHMDGATALQYVRSRHADSDLARNERQQGMLLALRDEGLQLNILGKLNQVLDEAKGALKTDLSFTQAGSLAKLAQSIPRDQVRQMSLTDDMMSEANIDGNAVLLPNWDAIRPAVQALLGQSDFKSEAATIAVMNGTDTPNLARQTAATLRAAGFTVPDADVGNPDDAGPGRYPQTYVLDFTGGQKPATLRQLLTVLKLGTDRVRPGPAAARPAGVDLEVMIGEDFSK